MSLIAGLKSRFAHLIEELAKFGSVGAVAFVLTLLLFNLTRHMGSIKATIFANVVATTFAYFANRYWTFRDKGGAGMRREYVLFFVFNAIGTGISAVFTGFTHYSLHREDALSANAALVLGTAVATLFRYWAYKKWVFRSAGPSVEALAEAVADVPPVPGGPSGTLPTWHVDGQTGPVRQTGQTGPNGPNVADQQPPHGPPLPPTHPFNRSNRSHSASYGSNGSFVPNNNP